jgi:CelD/BcsL family acetyltransferase involved in cellulose biosynthesis
MRTAGATIGNIVQPFRELGDDTIGAWSRLVSTLDLNPSLDPGWLGVSAASLAGGVGDLSVLMATDADGLNAVVPFFVRRSRMFGVPLVTIELGSNLMSYHAEFVGTPDPAAIVGALLETVPKWDVLHLANFSEGGRGVAALRRVATDLGLPLQELPGEQSPYLPITGSWEQFLASKGKKFRYKLRKRSEGIVKGGASELRWFGDSADTNALLKDMLSIEDRSWKAETRTSISARRAEVGYHERLLPWLRDRGMLLANVLYRAGQPIAYSLCCTCRGWIGHLKTSFDGAYETLSPGAYVIDACVQAAFGSGAREFDFLGDAAPHKLAWSHAVRRHCDLFLFAPRLLPRAIGTLKTTKRRLVSPAPAPVAGEERGDP